MKRFLWDAQNPKATVTWHYLGVINYVLSLVLGTAKIEKKETPTLRDQVFSDNKSTEDNLKILFLL